MSDCCELSVEEMDKILHLFPKAFMRMSQQDYQISASIYRLMLKGRPLSIEVISSFLGLPAKVIHQFLENSGGIYYNETGSVIGYWGLSLSETKHRFEVDDHGLYTWCAWDALFIPAIISKTALVTSNCPVTGSLIQLVVTSDGVKSANAADVCVSFIEPEAVGMQQSIAKSFCHYVNFFSSKSAGAHWVSANPGTFLLTLEEAFALGHRKNELQYVLSHKTEEV